MKINKRLYLIEQREKIQSLNLSKSQIFVKALTNFVNFVKVFQESNSIFLLICSYKKVDYGKKFEQKRNLQKVRRKHLRKLSYFNYHNSFLR